MIAKKTDIRNESELLEKIRELYEELRSKMKEDWQRDLPFEELLFDRWERAKKLGFGENASVYHNSYVFGDVTVGRDTWIGPFTLLDGSGGLEIGSNCSISSGVHIYSHSTAKWAVSGGKESYEHNPVRIGNCCFIGPNAVIKDGVSVGDHSIVGANSFVNANIPDHSIALGTPAAVVGRVDLEADGRATLRYMK